MKTLLALFILAAAAYGQAGPAFKGHRIGESVDEFFNTAHMPTPGGTAVSGQLSRDYCQEYLADPAYLSAAAKSEHEKPHRWHPVRPNELYGKFPDAESCLAIRAALAGKDVTIGLRFAADFGSGGQVAFRDGRLMVIEMTPPVSYEDAVSDMAQKLGAAPQQSRKEVQNAYGATLACRAAVWETRLLAVTIEENLSSEDADFPPTVRITESALLESARRRQITRPNSFD